MSWTDDLLPASFRGVGFEVLSHTFAGGRRTVVHEVPDADRAVTEDTGRKPRALTFEAFLIGSGNPGRIAALIEACERGGPGLLVHPVHGVLTVNLQDYEQTASWADGDAVGFRLSFVEAGDLDFFAPLSIGGGLLAEVDAVLALAGEVFDRLWSVSGFANFVLVEAVSAASLPLGYVRDALAAGLGAVETATGILVETRETIDGLTDTIEDFAAATVTDLVGQIEEIGALLDIASRALGVAPVYTGTPSQQQAQKNAHHAQRLAGRAAICEAARTIQGTELTDYDEAIRWRDTLAGYIDRECETLTEDDADALEPLRRLKASLVDDVTRRAALLPRATTYTPRAPLPSLVLAWALYRDPERAQEITSRNRIVHPARVPAEALDVLSE